MQSAVRRVIAVRRCAARQRRECIGDLDLGAAGPFDAERAVEAQGGALVHRIVPDGLTASSTTQRRRRINCLRPRPL